MEKIIRDYVSIVADLFELPDPIWDIGAYQVPGQEDLVNLRDTFAGRDFVGVDMRQGPGVDLVENVERITAPNESVGTILCLNTLEHVCNIISAGRQMYRVIKPGGVLVLSTPFDFMIHDFPGDYWRFTPQALSYLTRDFPQRIIGYQGYELIPRMTFAVAFKQESVAKLDEKTAQLKELFGEAARPKRPHLDRRIKMAIARRLAGERLFRTYDHQSQVDFWIEGKGTDNH